MMCIVTDKASAWGHFIGADKGLIPQCMRKDVSMYIKRRINIYNKIYQFIPKDVSMYIIRCNNVGISKEKRAKIYVTKTMSKRIVKHAYGQ